MTTIPNDFPTSEEMRIKVLRTIQRFENYITTENCMQHAYDEFE